jgi:23S rRNA (cytosine1962-C5)-methyltransferase
MPEIILKPGREKPVRRHHPWVFSGAIDHIRGNTTDGDVVEVIASDGTWMARGTINRRSQIVVRLLTWTEDERIDEDFWHSRLKRALAGRAGLASDPQTNAYRLVNAEGDGLPGLILDRYGDWLVIRSLTMGIETFKRRIVDQITGLLPACDIYEKSDAEVRVKEGLPQVTGIIKGAQPPELIEISENGLRFLVDVRYGHKTGFYLDQRENRKKTAPYLQGGKVLNCFSYTGAFAVYALAAGAESVSNIDSSEDVLQLARRNIDINRSAFENFKESVQCRNSENFHASKKSNPQTEYNNIKAEYLNGDVFTELRRFRDEGRRFDAVILDPPKFAQSGRQIINAARGYQDINRLALSIIQSGGILVTFSCSGLISSDLFQKIVFSASLEAEREVQLLERLGQPSDHPILITVPETEYLKGLICRVW